MNQKKMILTGIALIWGLQAPGAFAHAEFSIVYKLEAGSKLWLEGTATIGDFTCRTDNIEGVAKLHVNSGETYDSSSADTMSSEVRVFILVKSFECGNNAMNSDMYDAMKADSFPSIEYELLETEILPDSNTVDSMRMLNTNGRLTIAGVTKNVPMIITIRQLSSTRFQISGSKTLSMQDFGITPPTALWGLIKADDRLVVKFNLIVSKETFEPRKSETKGY